jgi:hypothetical protein
MRLRCWRISARAALSASSALRARSRQVASCAVSWAARSAACRRPPAAAASATAVLAAGLLQRKVRETLARRPTAAMVIGVFSRRIRVRVS